MKTKENHSVSGDLQSLQLLSTILLLKGHERIELGFRGCGYDLMSVKKDKTTLYNVKQRHFNSTKFGDICISEGDFNALLWAKNNENADFVRYVYIFRDVMFVSDEKNWMSKVLYAPETQMFDNHDIVKKPCKMKLIDDESLQRIDYRKINFNILKNVH